MFRLYFIQQLIRKLHNRFYLYGVCVTLSFVGDDTLLLSDGHLTRKSGVCQTYIITRPEWNRVKNFSPKILIEMYTPNSLIRRRSISIYKKRIFFYVILGWEIYILITTFFISLFVYHIILQFFLRYPWDKTSDYSSTCNKSWAYLHLRMSAIQLKYVKATANLQLHQFIKLENII